MKNTDINICCAASIILMTIGLLVGYQIGLRKGNEQIKEIRKHLLQIGVAEYVADESGEPQFKFKE